MAEIEGPRDGPPPVPLGDAVDRRTWQFGCEASNVAVARRRLEEVLDRHAWDRPDVDVVVLLLSELATNAVLHARSPFVVTTWIDGLAGVAVTDHKGVRHPALVDREPVDGGMGLKLVASLASRWGVHELDDRRSVWFEYHPTLESTRSHRARSRDTIVR